MTCWKKNQVTASMVRVSTLNTSPRTGLQSLSSSTEVGGSSLAAKLGHLDVAAKLSPPKPHGQVTCAMIEATLVMETKGQRILPNNSKTEMQLRRRKQAVKKTQMGSTF